MCVSICTGLTNGDAFSITTPPAVNTTATGTVAGSAATAAANSAVGTTVVDGTAGAPAPWALCLYDYLLIGSGRDSTNVEADRYCGNGLNPATGAVAAGAFIPGTLGSTQVCSKLCSLTFNLFEWHKHHYINYDCSSNKTIQDDLPHRQH